MPTKLTKYQELIDTLETIQSDDCMVWPYSKMHHRKWNYGQLTHKQKRVFVHRIAFWFTNGRWPEPLARHTCDNPPCFNPRHLVEGTVLDNSRDMVARGRAPSAARKLTANEVLAIRASVGGGYFNGTKALAAKFGITESGVYAIIKRRSWKHI